jgi:cytochrome bd-type quinol oxidase subunit 2
MTAFWVALSIALLVVWVFTVVDLFSRHLDRRHTLAWLLIIILLPFAGALLYWVLRRREAVGADSA